MEYNNIIHGKNFRMFIGDNPIPAVHEGSIRLDEDVEEAAKDIAWKNQSYSLSAEIEPSDDFKAFIDSLEYRSIVGNIEKQLDDTARTMADAICKNSASMEGLSENMQEKARKCARDAAERAIRWGWNMCYQFHKEIIEKQ